MRPRIGVTRCSATDDYVAAVTKAGGEPVVLDHGGDPRRAVEAVAGVLLTGGADVDPASYGERDHPSIQVDHARDRFELPLVRLALDRDLPVLAICRGIQVLNVAAGGTLIRDIPSDIGLAVTHAIAGSLTALAHAVRIEPRSRLAALLGAGPRRDAAEVLVNSRHHQAIKQVASGFVSSATAPDGVIEAIERPDARFCIGVQWHPENFHETGEFDGLFAGFVAACRRGTVT